MTEAKRWQDIEGLESSKCQFAIVLVQTDIWDLVVAEELVSPAFELRIRVSIPLCYATLMPIIARQR